MECKIKKKTIRDSKYKQVPIKSMFDYKTEVDPFHPIQPVGYKWTESGAVNLHQSVALLLIYTLDKKAYSLYSSQFSNFITKHRLLYRSGKLNNFGLFQPY